MTAGDDYDTGPYTVSFSAGESYVIVMVSTVEDNITELSEYFKVVINSTDQSNVVEIGSSNTSFITIEDNDPGVHAHADHAIACIFELSFCVSSKMWCACICMCVCMCELCCVWFGQGQRWSMCGVSNGSVQFPNSIDLIHIDTWQGNNISEAVSIHNCFFFICSCSSVV